MLVENDELIGFDIKAAAKSGWNTATSPFRTVKSTVGKIVRAPGDIAEAFATTAKGVGKGVASTANTLPIILTVAAVGVAGYLIFMGKAGKKVTPSISGNYPELLGRRSRRRR